MSTSLRVSIPDLVASLSTRVTVGAVMGEVGGENASCGWVMDLSCDLSSAISAHSSAISWQESKPALSIFM